MYLFFFFSILSDSNSRAVYDKYGKSAGMGEAGGEEAMPNPGELFGQLFGGKAFEDWIGEISLGKVSTNDSPPSQTPRERELNLSFLFRNFFRKFRKLSLVFSFSFIFCL